MVRRRGTPSPTWRSFLRNQAAGIAAIDLFIVASASFRLLYVMIILSHDRRKMVRFDVTPHPTAGWLSRQVTEAFPWDTAPRYLLRDRDASYGSEFCKRVDAMGITEIVTAPRSPWQNAFVERVIGSIRRECLDHIVIFNERHLHRVLSSYIDYYQRTRTHLSQGLPGPSPGHATHDRKSRRHPASQWPTSPLRTSRRLIRPISCSPILLHVGGTPAPQESLIGGFRSRTRLGHIRFNSQPVSYFSLQFDISPCHCSNSGSDGIFDRDSDVIT